MNYLKVNTSVTQSRLKNRPFLAALASHGFLTDHILSLTTALNLMIITYLLFKKLVIFISSVSILTYYDDFSSAF